MSQPRCISRSKKSSGFRSGSKQLFFFRCTVRGTVGRLSSSSSSSVRCDDARASETHARTGSGSSTARTRFRAESEIRRRRGRVRGFACQCVAMFVPTSSLGVPRGLSTGGAVGAKSRIVEPAAWGVSQWLSFAMLHSSGPAGCSSGPSSRLGQPQHTALDVTTVTPRSTAATALGVMWRLSTTPGAIPGSCPPFRASCGEPDRRVAPVRHSGRAVGTDTTTVGSDRRRLPLTSRLRSTATHRTRRDRSVRCRGLASARRSPRVLSEIAHRASCSITFRCSLSLRAGSGNRRNPHADSGPTSARRADA